MTTIQHEVYIAAPPAQVWQALADFGNIAIYNPGVSHSYLTSEQEQGVGMTRHCDLTLPGASLEERIIDWQEGQSYTLEIYQGQKLPPVHYIHVTLAVQPESEGSRASTRMEYKLKYGFLGALMDRLMVNKGMSGGMQGLLAGLKHYCETGELVESEQQVSLHAVAATASS
jgi:uncharacterized protein YndB with AHSA1/START domain